MMLSEPPGPKAVAEFDKLRRLVEAEDAIRRRLASKSGPQPAPAPKRTGARKSASGSEAGVTHVTLHNTFGGYHHKRMAGRSMTDHVAAMRRYRNAVADLL